MKIFALWWCRIASYDNDSSDINDTGSLSGSVAPGIPPEMSPEAFQAVPLSTEDAAAIYDLHMAYRNSLEVNEEGFLSRHHANLSDLVNIAELSVRRVIAMAKQVPAFRALPQVCLQVCLFGCLYVSVLLRELQWSVVAICHKSWGAGVQAWGHLSPSVNPPFFLPSRGLPRGSGQNPLTRCQTF